MARVFTADAGGRGFTQGDGSAGSAGWAVSSGPGCRFAQTDPRDIGFDLAPGPGTDLFQDFLALLVDGVTGELQAQRDFLGRQALSQA